MTLGRILTNRLTGIASGAAITVVFSFLTAEFSDAQQPNALQALHAEYDWQWTDGVKLDTAYASRIDDMMYPLERIEIIEMLEDADYSCIYGEAHPDYPEPAAQCTRSFATRACQMDWEVFVTSADGRVDEVTGSFVRDCVGDDRDWPRPLHSAIDDQLKPAELPPEQ